MVITPRDILAVAERFVNLFLNFAALIVVGFIVWAGVRMVMSRGNDSEFASAKSALVKAIIGGIVIFGVRVIVSTLVAVGRDPSWIFF